MDLTDNLLFVCVVGFLITAVFAITAWFALCAVGAVVGTALGSLYFFVLEPLFGISCQLFDRLSGTSSRKEEEIMNIEGASWNELITEGFRLESELCTAGVLERGWGGALERVDGALYEMTPDDYEIATSKLQRLQKIRIRLYKLHYDALTCDTKSRE